MRLQKFASILSELRYKISKTDRHSVHSKCRWNEILLQLDQHRINMYIYILFKNLCKKY